MRNLAIAKLCSLVLLCAGCATGPTATANSELSDSLLTWSMRADSSRGGTRTFAIGEDFALVAPDVDAFGYSLGRLSGRTRAIQWRFPLQFRSESAPAYLSEDWLIGGRICDLSEKQRWCIDAQTGVLQWFTPDAQTGEWGLVADPVFRSDFAYIALLSGAIREVDLRTGAHRILPARSLPRGNAIIAGILGMQVSGDTLFVASAAPDTTRRPRLGYQYLYLISLPSGELLTRFDPPDDSTHVAGGNILSFRNLLIFNTGSMAQTVAIDKTTGRVAWRYRYDGGGPFTLPKVVGDTGFIAGNDLYVHVVDLRTGVRIRRSRIPTTGSLSNGLVVCKDHIIAASDYLYVFERGGSMNWRRLFGGPEEPWIRSVSLLGFPTLVGETVVTPLRDYIVGLKCPQ